MAGVCTENNFCGVLLVHVQKNKGESDQDFEALFKSIDLDNTGLISYSEFLSASLSMKELSEEHQMLEMFDRLDHDKSGFIEREELVKQLGDIFHAKEVCVCVCVCVCVLY